MKLGTDHGNENLTGGYLGVGPRQGNNLVGLGWPKPTSGSHLINNISEKTLD